MGQDAAHPDRATQKKEAWWPAVEANWSLGKEGRSAVMLMLKFDIESFNVAAQIHIITFCNCLSLYSSV